jgi:SAM-dependent methyltransferase
MENQSTHNATQYEEKYQQGYGLVYPESHIIRVHRQILEWQLKMKGGRLFDFGCGSGSHLKYFADHGYVPYGCDTSRTAVDACKALMPKYADHFFTSEVMPDLPAKYAGQPFDVFLSNQVLYYLDDDGIRNIANQAYAILKPGGVFVVSMMPRSCWYASHVVGNKNGFDTVSLKSPRQTETMHINFKESSEWSTLFPKFKKLHLGSYGWHVREEEGEHVHWLFVGERTA